MPEPGAWTFGVNLAATSLHIQHIEDDDPGLVTPYWHNQRLLIGEVGVSAARGLGHGVGVGATVPFRWVRDRIRFEDLAGAPYTPPNPDTHHRNETLAHLADPRVTALFGGHAGAWTLNAAIGTTIPLGKTEENPFALGRAGLPHQHIQFGTGTLDPVVNVSAGRALGQFGVSASASAKFTFYENSKGYQAGDRFDAVVGASHGINASWRGNAGLRLDRELAEKWDGRIEEEGNLGRTDLFAQFGVSRSSTVGAMGLSVQVPIETWATGEQVKFPILVSLSWSR